QNTGTLVVFGGILSLYDTGTNAGRIALERLTILNLFNNFQFLAGTNVTGLGAVQVLGTTVTVLGTASIAGVRLEGGTLTGPGMVTVTGTMILQEGRLLGTGDILVTGGLVLDGPAANVLSQRNLTVRGQVLWVGGDWVVEHGSRINILSGGSL